MVEGIVEIWLQAIGWSVLKVVTFGHYQGFRSQDALAEGALGLLVIAAVCTALYLWW